MAINWKLRETVLRLLTAVYAEIGEEGFKGRYGRIAQFFGPDATYDAIKSFFAKEIARRAERLRAQHPGLRVPRRRLMNGTSRASLDATPTYNEEEDEMQAEPEDYEEQEIRITGTQQVRRYFACPPRRPATIDLTTETDASEPQSQQPFSLDRDSVQPVPNGIATQTDRVRPHPQQPANTRQKITSPPGLPRSIPVQSNNPAPRQRISQPVNRKRPYAATIDIDDMLDEPNEPIVQPRRHTTATTLPFGYATRDNRYRCALCSSNFSSQQALDRHEATNQAHKNNLANTFMVDRARSRLATINEATSAGPSRSSAAMRPARAAPPNDAFADGEVSTPITQTIHAQSHQRSQHPAARPRPLSIPSAFDEGESESITLHPPEVRAMLFSGPGARASAPPASLFTPTESPVTPASGPQASPGDKGKGQAMTPELTPSTGLGRGDLDYGSSSFSSDNASAELQLHRSLARAQTPADLEHPGMNALHQQPAPEHQTARPRNLEQRPNTGAAPSPLAPPPPPHAQQHPQQSRQHQPLQAPVPAPAPANATGSEASYAQAIIQLRASIGVLGERYIETHPEWLAPMMAAVQREVVRGGGNGADSGFGSSEDSDRSREMPPPLPRMRERGGSTETGTVRVSDGVVGGRGESVGTTATGSTEETTPGFWVGSRVRFGGTGCFRGGMEGGVRGKVNGRAQGFDGDNAEIHCVGPDRLNEGARLGETSREVARGKKQDTVVILVD